jgi:hypothetical protein
VHRLSAESTASILSSSLRKITLLQLELDKTKAYGHLLSNAIIRPLDEQNESTYPTDKSQDQDGGNESPNSHD